MKENWDIDFRYVFSGSLTHRMHDMLMDTKNFEPLDILVSQLDRSGIRQAINWKHEGFCRWLFCDSGAFSVHTGKASVTQDEYIEYVNSIIDDVDVFAQLDTIPGTFGQPKSQEDYVKSAEDSWTNFIYMRNKVKDKHKIMPVFHFGEDTKYLKRMLDYVDDDGDKLDYIGLSPANDASVKDRMKYLQNMYDIIRDSSNPSVKTHVYGFTSLTAMSKFPCYSADSISHRLISGYNKIFTENFGVVSVSRKPRSVKNKSNLSFIETCDEYNLNILRSEFEYFGMNKDFLKKYDLDYEDAIEAISEDNNLRVVFSIRTIQKLMATRYKYSTDNLVRPKKLFNLKD